MNKMILLAGASLLIPSTAFAQSEPGQPAPPSGRAAEADAEGGAQIQDIIVTASRRNESVQRTALSIQAITGADLTAKGIFRQEDLNAIAPGVTLGTAGNYPQTYIRGVGNFAANSQDEPAVAINIDGVYVGRPWATRGAFFDLDRVEVLKGPQGTLYGRNASGGAINLISVRPKIGDLSGFGEVEAGNYDLRRIAGAVNVPLGETMAARISGQLVDRDGYLSGGADDDETRSLRLQLLFQPSTDLSVLLRGVYQRAGGVGSGAVVVGQNIPDRDFRQNNDPAATAIYRAEPFFGPLLQLPSDDSFVHLETYELGAELNWSLGWATLTVLPSFRESWLEDIGYVPGYRVHNGEHARQGSLEARLSGDAGGFKWVLGGFYYKERQFDGRGNRNFAVELGPQTVAIPDFFASTESAAAFGQLTYSVTDRLRLTGGLRYTWERKTVDLTFATTQVPFGPACTPPFTTTPNPLRPAQICNYAIEQDDRRSFNNVSWKAGVEFDLAPQSLAYFNAGTGFKSGGFYGAPLPFGRFDPEKLLAFDAGIKNRFLGNRLQLNIEAFHWIYKDQQTSALTLLPNGGLTQGIFNAGRAKITGADIDITYQPTDHDTLSAKAEYIRSRYERFTLTQFIDGPTGCAVSAPAAPRTLNCAGLPLARTPKWSGTAAYTHIFDLQETGRLDATIDTQFASRAVTGFDYLPEQVQRAYAIVNASLTYHLPGDHVRITGYVRNIGDRQIVTQAFRHAFLSGANPLASPNGLFSATVRPPRTYGLMVRANF